MSANMNEQIFWKIIEVLHLNIYAVEERFTRMENDLLSLPEEDLFKFDKILWWQLEKSSTDELWAASYILTKEFTALAFVNFRLWLIMQGQRVFKKAINDAETLEVFIDDFKFDKIKLEKYKSFSTLVEQIYTTKTRKSDYKEVNTLLKELNEEEEERGDVQQEFMDLLPELAEKMGWKVEVFKGEWNSDK